MRNHVKQFKEQVIVPTLDYLGPKFASEEATDLMLGTVAQESKFIFLCQLGGGPALGYYQIEPFTLHDIHKNYLAFNPDLDLKIKAVMVQGLAEQRQAITNLTYATAMARLIYFRVSEKLPVKKSFVQGSDFWLGGYVKALAAYYKKHFNTPEGKATEKEYFDNYYKFIVEGQ